MFKRILIAAFLFIPACLLAQPTESQNECKRMQTERKELQSALRKAHLLDEISVYKLRIDNLSSRISESCFTKEQIAEKTNALYRKDFSDLESSVSQPLTAQALSSKQAAWERFYVMPTRCIEKALELKNLDWCIENKQIQFQQFDMLWQQKNVQTTRSEAKPTDTFHEFILPSKAERAKILAQQESKRYSRTSETILPANIIVLCCIALTAFFSIIFVYHWLMQSRTSIK
jgi:hypothetical protein